MVLLSVRDGDTARSIRDIGVLMTELLIEKLGSKGDGIASHNGQDVFVPFSVPGERVEGDIEDGRIAKPRILEPVALRVKAPCSHFKTCGGCATQHIDPAFLADWKRNLVRTALAQHGLETELRDTITSPPQSRRRAVFTGKRTKASAFLGFHARGTAQIIPITHCTLLHPDISEGFDGLKALVQIAASRKSEIRIAATASIGGLDVSVDNALPLTPQIQAHVVKITHDHGLSRVFWNGEIVLEREPAQHRFGEALVTPPNGSFLQATKEGEIALVDTVMSIVGQAKSVADLFSGCGTFSLPLAKIAEVAAFESDREMLAALDKGWRVATGLKKVTTAPRDLFRNPMRPDELNPFDAVVIDPPRAGAKAQTEQLAASEVKTIAFVSCNPATFARDARVLVDGGYTLDWVQTVDQFLWSEHCELVAQFTRN
ncbi:TRAM domain-containing protein [Amylibacter sp. IMCC11727]|uniref:class I SAM-dependent RNA methyltransferase n=1 Tax=Amylibacter sp. IMCC11727 TaxID=3039851 RepID=UPI003265DAE2